MQKLATTVNYELQESMELANEQGETLIEWCKAHYMNILNTTFKHHKRRLHTWKSPGDLFRNQIDYICINQRFRNSVKNCKTLPGADCNSDHILLVMQMICKLKKVKNPNRKEEQISQHYSKTPN